MRIGDTVAVADLPVTSGQPQRIRIASRVHGSARRQADPVTGVLTDASLAFGVAELAQEQGAEVVLTGAGRGLSLTQRTARKLPRRADVLEFDVTDPEHVAAVARRARPSGGTGVDGALHAIGFAPAVVPRRRLHRRHRGTTWRSPCTSRPTR